MHVPKDHVDVRMEVPGAVIRQRTDLATRADSPRSAPSISPSRLASIPPRSSRDSRQSLPVPPLGLRLARPAHHDRCARRAGDRGANDLFYWPPGHNVKVDADAEIVMFSPQHEHSQVIDHMIAKVQGEPRLLVMTHATKQRLLDAGLAMLLEHGYNDLGIQALLEATQHPEGFVLPPFQGQGGLRAAGHRPVHASRCMPVSMPVSATSAGPAGAGAVLLRDDRRRLSGAGLHGLPPGRAGTGTVGRQRGVPAQDRGLLSRSPSGWRPAWTRREQRGELPADSDPRHMASVLVDCWEGAALRSRLRGNARR